MNNMLLHVCMHIVHILSHYHEATIKAFGPDKKLMHTTIRGWVFASRNRRSNTLYYTMYNTNICDFQYHVQWRTQKMTFDVLSIGLPGFTWR